MLAGRATTCRNEIKLQLIAKLKCSVAVKSREDNNFNFFFPDFPPRLSYDVKFCVQEQGNTCKVESPESFYRAGGCKRIFCGNLCSKIILQKDQSPSLPHARFGDAISKKKPEAESALFNSL